MHHCRKKWLISHYHTGFLWAPHVGESWNTWCCDCIQRSGLHADGYDCVEEWMLNVWDPWWTTIQFHCFWSGKWNTEVPVDWFVEGTPLPFMMRRRWDFSYLLSMSDVVLRHTLRWCWGCDDWLEWWNCISWEDEWSRFQCSWCCTDYMGVIQEDC